MKNVMHTLEEPWAGISITLVFKCNYKPACLRVKRSRYITNIFEQLLLLRINLIINGFYCVKITNSLQRSIMTKKSY